MLPQDRQQAPPGLADVFVGRQAELGVLHAALEDTLAGRGRLVMLAGEPGIGKTRIAREFTAYAAAHGALVLWGRGHESAGVPPYWLWMQMLRTYVRDSDAEQVRTEMDTGVADIAVLVPEVRSRLPDLPAPARVEDPEHARFRLFDSISVFLQRAARNHPLVLVLDDLHWADKPSLLFLEFLVPELSGSRLLVLGTYRDMELSRQHPFSETLGELTRERSVQRLPLRGLSRGEVERLIVLTTGIHPPPALVGAVHTQTEGNPLFLTEAVRLLVQEGELTSERLRQSQSVTIGIPAGVRAVIGKRLNRLSPPCNQALTMAAVIGREFDLQEVTQLMATLPEGRVLELLEEAVAARVLEEVPQMAGRYQFTHALMQATLYDELTTVRRVQLHRHVGEVLETLYQAHLEPHLHRLAHHFCAAAQMGNGDKAIVYAERAGAQALALLAYEEAAHYYRLALLALERQEPAAEAQRRRLLLALGEAQRKSGEYPQALETFQHVADLARRSDVPEHLAYAALGFEETSWRPGLPGDAAARLLKEALSALGETESHLKVRVLGRLARAMVFTGALEQAAVVEKQAVGMARRLGDPATLATTLLASLSTRWRPEHIATRLATTAELISLAEAAGDRDMLLQTYSWRLFDLMDLGDLPAVEAQLAVHTQLAAEFRQPFYLYINVTFRAMHAIFTGRFAEGEQLAQQAFTIGQRLRGQDALGVFSMQMFTLRREQGRLQELAPVVRHFVQTSPDASTWRPGLAVIYRELGLVPETRAEFERLAAHDFTDIPQDAVWVTCVAYLAEVCAFLGDVRRAAILYRFLTPFDGYNITVGPTAACYGAAARYLGMLAAAMSHWDVAQRHFTDALAMNACMDARPWLAHTQYAYARMLLARGLARDHEQAASLLEAARTISHELGMPTLEERVLALLGQTVSQPGSARSYPAGLTQREVEVLGLIAAGKSNQEIADALGISFYTVANHVRSILAKIGAANRTEAAAYAIRHSLAAGSASPKG